MKRAYVETQFAFSDSAKLQLVQAAVAKAEALDLKIAVSLASPSGEVVAFVKMHGALLVSVEMSEIKARSAAGLGVDAEVTEKMLDSFPLRVRDGLLRTKSVCLVRGGLPIFYKGALVGGLGVSGGTEEQDLECARESLCSVPDFSTRPI